MSSEIISSASAAGRANSDGVQTTVGERARATVVAVAPLVLVAAFVAHPYIGLGLPDEAAIAKAAASNTFRWGISHLLTGIASALLILAFLAIRSYLSDAGEQRWSARALAFVTVGGTLYAILPGMEFAVLAAAETGGDVRAAQAAVEPWFVPVIMASGVMSAIGFLGFAIAVSSIRTASLRIPRFVIVALAMLALTRVVPLTAVQFYVQGAASLIALWPLAYVMWRHPEVTPDTVAERSVRR